MQSDDAEKEPRVDQSKPWSMSCVGIYSVFLYVYWTTEWCKVKLLRRYKYRSATVTLMLLNTQN